MTDEYELLERALEELYAAYRGKRHYPPIFIDIHKYLNTNAKVEEAPLDISAVDDAMKCAMSKYLYTNKEGFCSVSFARGALWAAEYIRARDGGGD